MIDYIRIQNFRSITDATFHLQDVNLLVGANNSGKTNFLKALQFLSNLYNQKPIDDSILKNFKDFDGNNEMSFTIISRPTNKDYFLFYKLNLIFYKDELFFYECFGESTIDYKSILSLDIKELSELEVYCTYFHYNYFYNKNLFWGNYNSTFDETTDITKNKSSYSFIYDEKMTEYQQKIVGTNEFNYPLLFLKFSQSTITTKMVKLFKFNNTFNTLRIYKPNLTNLKSANKLTDFELISEDSSNLVTFIDFVNNEHPHILETINKQLSECVPEFVKVTTPNHKKDGQIVGKKLNFINKNGTNFSADDVSDGVLYFLSLLCIINQPNAPKLLLLEEPENGIHPVRIQEIINYIFKLAQDKNIQIILTSHSPVVIDLFTDYPESIFIFNKEKNDTEVKNLNEIIVQYKKDFGDKVDVLSNLSANWFAGLIGGVPEVK